MISNSPLQRQDKNSSEIIEDIILEKPYSDGVSVILCHKKRHFLVYLSIYAKNILPPEEYQILFPKIMNGVEKTQAINKFIAISHKFKNIPIFAIAYASYLLSSDERPFLYYEKIARHIINFIENQDNLPSSILSTLIPLSFTKVNSCTDLCIRILNTVVEIFGANIVFEYCLQYIKEIDSSIVVDFFANNISRYKLSKELQEKYITTSELQLADTNCQCPHSWNKLYSVLTNTRNILQIHVPLTPNSKSNQHLLAQWPKSILSKTSKTPRPERHATFRFDSNSKLTIDSDSDDEYLTPTKIYTKDSFNSTTNSSSPYSTSISLASSPRRTPRKASIKQQPQTDDIYELLREIEINPTDELLKRIKNYLISATSLPANLNIKQLFIESMVAFKRPEMQQDIYILVSRLHALVNPQDMLDVYLGIRSLMYSKRKKINISDVDMHYLSFLRLHSQDLEEGYPQTLDEVNVDVHNELMSGFELLTQWDTSYAGIVKIYDVLKQDPTLNILDYFDPIEDPFKSFLITGLDRSASADNFVDLQPTIELLKQRMDEGNAADILEESMDRLNEKMLDAIAKTSPDGEKKKIPRFVKTPSNVIIKFMSSDEEDEDTTEENENSINEY
ncbi:hypothetical protein TVAG_163150 [Trichomonas vaginalis G3]|uniref:Uncharacterized protein n=1 Tax=Trichomonas vaginalis (strain ATCC PRA-98 / G3) TaxID=412133 RepID=A2DFZ2_TRIV3|nr:hypothetical protein TVAGG3_0952880 [Trichomonas vaginalis G3]EAY20619.1 hypothetical protein TVAG_163150 [Trichomonas vaginalis G3]KAI5487334.1 hypothetical protein TVAGG3_0952880 [Trichomonas vaginalis G3]|eukprot:XP_001581605.1 hypothetical protein [Trichomonas vaginalis G3]